MKIEFEINELQEKTLLELMAKIKSEVKVSTPSELAKSVFLGFIIQGKQRLITEELSK